MQHHIQANEMFLNHFQAAENNLEASKKRKQRHLFQPEEDELLIKLVKQYGNNQWSLIADRMPGRTSRQVKERYNTYLGPNVRKTPWTHEEDMILLEKVPVVGKKWSDLAKFFDGRSPNSIKNRYHLHLRGHLHDYRTNRKRKGMQKKDEPVKEEQSLYPSMESLLNQHPEHSERLKTDGNNGEMTKKPQHVLFPPIDIPFAKLSLPI